MRHDGLRYRRRGDDGKAIHFLGGECRGQIMGQGFQEIALGVFLWAVILAIAFHGAAVHGPGAGKGTAWLVLTQFSVTHTRFRRIPGAELVIARILLAFHIGLGAAAIGQNEPMAWRSVFI